jgi:DNA-binding NarL/FixJ family response regulator
MRLLIVDDDKLVCESLRMIVEIGSRRDQQEAVEVVGIGHDGYAAMELYEKLRPDILLMDIRMDRMDGITAGKNILAKDPDARILYLTTFLDDEYILEALRIGAKGYLMKSSYDAVLSSLYAVQNGQPVFSAIASVAIS